jgi:hypothetical protein
MEEADLDRCWRTFLIFLACPNPKRYAWARFTNTNPATDDDHVTSITVFYREDEPSLLFAVERASGDYRPEIYRTGVNREDLCELKSLAELWGSIRE